jgi:hypothetical protein
MATFPNRCHYIKVNGTQCGSPALRRNRFCYFHKRYHEERIRLNTERARQRPATFELPVLEDANSIQMSLMQIMRLLVARQIDPKIAGLLLYALQTASCNLRLTNFEPLMNDVVLDPRQVGETALEEHIWNEEDFEEEEEDEDEDEDESTPAVRVTESGKAVVVGPQSSARHPPETPEAAAIRDKIREQFFRSQMLTQSG